MSAHTPGPCCYIEHDIRHDTYKTVYCPLHAAAPALLEALEEAEPHIRGLGSAHALAAVRAAIAQARGEKS